MTLTSL